MIPATRITVLSALVVALALIGAACSPAAGPLGSPATPAASAGASDGPAPSDVAPATAATSPSAAPSTSVEPSKEPSSEPTESAATSTAPTPTASPAGTIIVRAYFVLGSFTGNEGLAPVLREIPATKGVAAAAMRELLAGPRGAELAGSPAMYSAIPDATRLLGVDVAGGTATVDLSGGFASGGGSETMFGRLAQVVYTLTQFSSIDEVVFHLDGSPVTTFGPEGIILAGPVARSDYRDVLPAIFVDRPAWGAAGGNPIRLTGLANVFEAQFVAQVLDGKGHLLVEQAVKASCGTGCWGTFRTDIAYEIGKAQYGTLRVFERSAKDGKPINVTEYRIWLTP